VAVNNAAPNVEVLSAWKGAASVPLLPKGCDAVLAKLEDPMPSVAHRALSDNLSTAQWEPFDTSWHLAVPAVRTGKSAVVGLSHRRGYTYRFTSLDVAAIRSGLAS
jgi:hypothetical protein